MKQKRCRNSSGFKRLECTGYVTRFLKNDKENVKRKKEDKKSRSRSFLDLIKKEGRKCVKREIEIEIENKEKERKK